MVHTNHSVSLASQSSNVRDIEAKIVFPRTHGILSTVKLRSQHSKLYSVSFTGSDVYQCVIHCDDELLIICSEATNIFP